MATLKALKDKARLEKKIAKGVEEEDRAVNQSKFGLGFYIPNISLIQHC